MKIQKRTLLFFFVCFLRASVYGQTESVRFLIDGIQTVTLRETSGVSVPLSYLSSSLIKLEGDFRFFRGIQLELSAPQSFLAYPGSLAAALYGNLIQVPETGVVDAECSRLAFNPLPEKLQTIYQIPLRENHGLRTTPYSVVLTGVLEASVFPLVFRLMPVIKGISGELETAVFHLRAKPILSDEGAVRINFRYPFNLPDKPLSVLIDDEVIDNPGEERLIKEGEHSLVILSENYRNQSSRFVVERAKILELTVELRDTTPLVIFESPENARVYLDGVFIPNPQNPTPVESGLHEVRFEVSDYTITRPLTVQKGKTYRVALSVDVNITESE